MKIHVSEATAELLRAHDFIVVERGQMEVKVSELKSLSCHVMSCHVMSMGPL